MFSKHREQQQSHPLQQSKKLRQKHRENERVRHHTLNELMKKLCCQIPGDEEYSKGTKVVNMQRAICYIVYLEKMIMNVCKELNLDDSNLPFASRLSHEDITKSLWGQNDNDFKIATNQCRKFPTLTKSGPQNFIHKNRKNHNRISSTILNTSGNHLAPLKEDSEVEYFPEMSSSQENSYLSNDEHHFHDPVMCYIYSKSPASGECNSLFDNSCSLQTFDTNHGSNFLNGGHFTEDSSSGLNDFVPIYNQSNQSALLKNDPMFQQVTDSPGNTCIKKNKYEMYMKTDEEFECAFSDQFNPVDFTNFYSNVPASQEFKSNRSQLVPEMSIKDENLSPRKPYSKRPRRRVVSKKGRLEYCKNFFELPNTRRHNLDMTTLKEDNCDQIGKKRETVLQRNVELKDPVKVDRRRISWMNGFMMFSQMNRRTFIDLNPGIHTSHISKMMGNVWKAMSPNKQLPYKEKAKKCAQYLQDSLLLTQSNDHVSDVTLEDKEKTLLTANDVDEEFTTKFE